MMSDRNRVLHCHQLNSGIVTRSLRGDVGDELIALMTPLLESGAHRMLEPMDDYECRITVTGNSLLATICCNQRPCMAAGVASEAASASVLWQEIDDLFQSLSLAATNTKCASPETRQPTATPWCASMIVQATEEEVRWMEDFTRCLAWAWVSRSMTSAGN